MTITKFYIYACIHVNVYVSYAHLYLSVFLSVYCYSYLGIDLCPYVVLRSSSALLLPSIFILKWMTCLPHPPGLSKLWESKVPSGKFCLEDSRTAETDCYLRLPDGYQVCNKSVWTAHWCLASCNSGSHSMGDLFLKNIELLPKVSPLSEWDPNICYHGLDMWFLLCIGWRYTSI